MSAVDTQQSGGVNGRFLCSHRAAAGQYLHKLISALPSPLLMAQNLLIVKGEKSAKAVGPFFPCCMLCYARPENLSMYMPEQRVLAFNVA